MGENFGRNLLTIRKKKSLTQRQLASMAGLSKGAISQFEQGSSSVSLVTLIKLTQALDVSLDELVFSGMEEKVTPVTKSIDERRDKTIDLLDLALRKSYKEIERLEKDLTECRGRLITQNQKK